MTHMDLRQYETEAKRARTDSRFQKQAFLDLPRPSRDREEGLEGYERRDYDRHDSDRYTHIRLYI